MAENEAQYRGRIELIFSDLQIPPSYGAQRGLRLYPEATEPWHWVLEAIEEVRM
jgi:hypothetical protein